MKILKSLLVVYFSLLTQMSLAGSFIDSASVVSVDKVYKQVRVEEPYQECYIKETVQNNGDGSATNEIIGGVIGGAIGNKLGKGDGNDIMTLAGILMGASIANDAEKAAANGKQTIVSQEVCEKKVRQKIEKRLSHYKVTVDYNGQQIDGSTKDVLDIGDLKSKFESFGWKVLEMENGNSLDEVNSTLSLAKENSKKGKPIVILMKTVMGNGVDFMMHTHEWHGKAPNDEQLEIALNQNPETLGDY